MQTKQASLRTRILILLMPLMLLLIVVDSTILHRFALNTLEKELDADLHGSVTDISEYLDIYGLGAKNIEILENASRILLNDATDKVLYCISDGNNTLLGGNIDLCEQSKSKIINSNLAPHTLHLFFTKVNKEKYRVVHSTFNLKNNFNTPKKINILVGVTLKRRDQLADKILMGLVVPQLLLVLVSFIVIPMSVKKGLAPLNELQDQVSKRSEKNLAPIDLPNIPEEVFLLTKSVNHLMQQLQNLIAVQNRFIADAAHQLRTPLAGALAQLELAELGGNADLLKSTLPIVHLSLDRLLHTVNQLLVLAKSQPEAIAMIKMSPIDLKSIAKAVISDMTLTAIQKEIDLGFQSSETPAFVTGNAERLTALLYNLVDNAIRYTQAGGEVTVSVMETDDKVVLSVADNGPGISNEERGKAFDRFHRVIDSGQEGSGLGLAIVKEIADLHGAIIAVTDEAKHKGLQVFVSFNKHNNDEVKV